MFHRYQYSAFKSNFVSQNLATYPFTAENIELAVLEGRALKAAIEATTPVDRDTAARHFAGLRLSRRAAEERVELDDAQEHIEGSARFIEHKFAGNEVSFDFNEAVFATGLTTELDEIATGGLN